MAEQQAPAGWYPDQGGNQRYWDGNRWTEHVQPAPVVDRPAEPEKKVRAFSKLKQKKAAAQADREAREQAETEVAQAAGRMVTSGVFGTATIEIFAGGYVRIAVTSGAGDPAHPVARLMTKRGSYEKLLSIRYTGPANEQESSSSVLDGVVSPAVANLLKGGKGLLKSSAPGLVVAGVGHVASAGGRKSFLTITTDKRIHQLTNEAPNSVGMNMPNKAHNAVGRALAEAGLRVLGVSAESGPATDAPVHEQRSANGGAQESSESTLAVRLRELAALHREGILSDEEFASAKATLLGGL